MTDAKTSGDMFPQLQKVVAGARSHPRRGSSRWRIGSMCRLWSEPHRLREDAAVGVDGVSKAEYGQDLERKLQDLHRRLKSRRWRHQPIRRVHIPKGEGKTRPIEHLGTGGQEVQDSVREVLEAVYEQDFLKCSYVGPASRPRHER